MINTAVLKETIVYFCKAKRLPGSVCKETLYRWAKKGRRVVDSNERTTLEWCYLGHFRVTSVEAFDRFIARTNGELALPAPKPRKKK